MLKGLEPILEMKVLIHLLEYLMALLLFINQNTTLIKSEKPTSLSGMELNLTTIPTLTRISWQA